MLPHPLRLERGQVRAWYADIDVLASRDRVDAGLSWLTTAERERYHRFYADQDRLMFLLGRMLARSLVGAALDVPPAAWTWREGDRGRPEVAAPSTALRFNLAHSAGLVICALACGREVGVDVEDLERQPVDRAVVDRYCAPAEIADISARGAGWHDRFLRYWTLKEAYLKARGLGISMPLAEISFSSDDGRAAVSFLGSLAGTDDRWTFFMARPTPRHLVALAASAADGVQPEYELRSCPAELFA